MSDKNQQNGGRSSKFWAAQNTDEVSNDQKKRPEYLVYGFRKGPKTTTEAFKLADEYHEKGDVATARKICKVAHSAVKKNKILGLHSK